MKAATENQRDRSTRVVSSFQGPSTVKEVKCKKHFGLDTLNEPLRMHSELRYSLGRALNGTREKCCLAVAAWIGDKIPPKTDGIYQRWRDGTRVWAESGSLKTGLVHEETEFRRTLHESSDSKQ
jgi:hypothetical protein